MIVFFVTGLWHGASWNFIIWGVAHGIMLVLEQLFLEGLFSKMPKFISNLYTLIVVVTAWVFFRANDLPQSITFIKSMYSLESSTQAAKSHLDYILSPIFLIISVFGLLFATPIMSTISSYVHQKGRLVLVLYYLTLFVLFALTMTYMAAGTYNPFIYFRF